jgi:hypothetical protein
MPSILQRGGRPSQGSAWRFAVRVTEPRAHVRERGEPSAVLLGAYAAADDLWSQSSLLL